MEAARYPKPRIPILPVLGRDEEPHGSGPSAAHSRFLSPDVVALHDGRSALAHALALSGVGAGHEVLVPSYHCGSMIEPAVWLGATVVFFKITLELTFDWQDLERKITDRSRALIAPHYFGFPQPMEQLVSLCRAHGIALIEDCAHAFFGQIPETAPGYLGDFSIASTRKFFPGADGGMLCANPPRTLDLDLRSLSIVEQTRSAWTIVENAISHGRLRPLRPIPRIISMLRRSFTPMARPQTDQTRAAEGRYRWFDPDKLSMPMSATSRRLITGGSLARMARQRREHFDYLCRCLDNVKGVTPLYSEVPEGVVPYMLPLLLDHPQIAFPALKMASVPIWRWEDLAITDCQVSLDYRTRLIHIPCHQSLTKAELDWIASTIANVLGCLPSSLSEPDA